MNSRSHASQDILIEASNVSKSFGGVQAVNDVSFQVPRGKIVSIIGPNGAGKTTLFNCLSGIYAPDSGTLYFGPRLVPLCRLPAHEISAIGVARTFQTIRLFKQMTALENVMVGAHTRLKSGLFSSLMRPRWVREEEERIREEAKAILAFLGLAHEAHATADGLAYAAQRRLEIARALASKPQCLLLDEPAAGMNPSEKNDLLELIQTLRRQGLTLLLIEHDMKVVMPVSDRVIVLDHGKKIADGSPKDVCNHPRVIEAYLGKQ